MDLSKLEALEGRIDALLNRTASLSQQNRLLEETLEVAQGEQLATEARLNEAEAKIVVMQNENETIVNKIDSLLERLEKI